jgi:hypothetical protein
MEEYISKATITSISASSRASVKVADNFYTIEYHEDRTIPDVEGVDIESERKLLWDTVNNEVDTQVEDILKMFTKKR